MAGDSDGKGKLVRTVTKERLVMPAKVEAAEGLRRMLGWDRKPETEVPDDITELMVMIRRKPQEGNTLPRRPKAHNRSRSCLVSVLEPLPKLSEPSVANT